MCIRDRGNSPTCNGGRRTCVLIEGAHYPKQHYDLTEPVSYTHLDVYKRQALVNGDEHVHLEDRAVRLLREFVSAVAEMCIRDSFDTHSVGRLVTRITSDVDAINEMFTAGVLAIVDDFLNLAIMAALMLTINWRLALLAFSVLPLILIVTRLFRDHVRESYRRVRTAIGRINSFSQEYVSGMSVVQLFNREQRAFDDFAVVNRQHLVAFKDTIFAYALFYPAVDLLSIVAIALVVSRGGFGVLSGAVTIGVLNMFIQYSLRFWRPIQDMSDKYNILQSAMAASERIFRLLDTQPEIVSPAQPLAGDGSNRIEFRHVWFTYQKLTEQQQAAVAAATEDAFPQGLKPGDSMAQLAARLKSCPDTVRAPESSISAACLTPEVNRCV